MPCMETKIPEERRRDEGISEQIDGYVNRGEFVMESKVMQPTLPLPEMLTLAGNTNARKEGLATVPTVPQHEKRLGNSHRRS
ncbi:hypothetical protein ACSBR1_015526 [Camellia fascicularis]